MNPVLTNLTYIPEVLYKVPSVYQMTSGNHMGLACYRELPCVIGARAKPILCRGVQGSSDLK